MVVRNKKNKNKKKKEPDEQYLSYHVVFFMDILGQKDKIRNLRSLPTNEKEEDVIEILKQTVTVVRKTRELFKTFYNASLNTQSHILKIPKEHRNDYLKMRKSELKFRGFSDSLIISVPMKNDNEYCTPMNDTYTALLGACSMVLVSLAMGHPIRGGVDVGLCMDIEPNEIYGAAIERAYSLESNFAEYPRILIGSTLLSYLHAISDQVSETPFGKMAKSTADRCLSLLAPDIDGQIILNFLCEEVRKIDKYEEEIIPRAYNFAFKEYDKYMSLDNRKLASRYGRLLSYFSYQLGEKRIDEILSADT